MTETAALLKRLYDAKITQAEISRLTGIPQFRLSRWQRGIGCDSADDALRLHREAQRLLRRKAK